jgi:hypothetical protein
VELTAVQRRTVTDLIGAGPPPAWPDGLVDEVRGGLEQRLHELGVGRVRDRLWLGKGRLGALDRCPGSFAAAMAGERAPFELTARVAAGRLFHKAIELDVVTERDHDPRTVCDAARTALAEEAPFARLWDGMDPFDRAGLVVEAGRRLERFRDSFPPLRRRWSPQPELALKASLAGGRVILAGVPDLVLGRRRRLVLDLKAFGAWPEYVEDLRFYALLLLLRTGVPPYRVATVFLESGTWQAEDVDPDVLRHAADRVARAVERALGPEPAVGELRPGRHCSWCPRAPGCPVSAATPDSIATDR